MMPAQALVSPFVDTAPETAIVVAHDKVFDSSLHRARSLGIRFSMVIRPSEVLEVIYDRYGFTPDEIKSKDRHKTIAHARHMAVWMLRETGLSFPEIGRLLGGRDHTTAMSSVKEAEKRLDLDPEERESLRVLLVRTPKPTPALALPAAPSPMRLVEGEGMMLEGMDAP